MSSNVLTLCAIFLPLSSLWASANVSSRSQASLNLNGGHNPLSTAHTGSSRPLVSEKNFKGSLSPTDTETTRASKTSILSTGGHLDIYRDLEAADGDEEKHT